MAHSCFMDAKSYNPFCLLRLKRERQIKTGGGELRGLKAFPCTRRLHWLLGPEVWRVFQFRHSLRWGKQTSGLLWCRAFLMSCSLISIHGDKVNSVSTIPLVCWPAAFCPQATKRSKGPCVFCFLFHPPRTSVLSSLNYNMGLYSLCQHKDLSEVEGTGANLGGISRARLVWSGWKWVQASWISPSPPPARHSWPPV